MRFAQLKTVAALAALVLGLTAALAAARSGPVPPKAESDSGPKDPAAKERDALKGKWRFVKHEVGRAAVDADSLVNRRAFFDGNELSFFNETVEEPEMLERIGIAIDPAAAPRRIDLTRCFDAPNPEAGNVYLGIYERKDDALSLCVRLDSFDAKDRPAEFKAAKGVVLWKLERIKDEKEERKALGGEWKCVQLCVSGEELTEKDAEMTWSVEGPSARLVGGLVKDEKLALRLDPAAALPKLDFTATDGKEKGTQLVGIYFRQENKLTVCFADPKVKDAVRPTELTPGDGRVFVVLERKPKK